MNKKITYILVAVVIVVIGAAVAGVLLLNGGSNGGNNNGGGNTQPVSVANATSLEFKANITSQGTTVTHLFYGKNIGTSNLTIRLDILGGESGNWSYILNAGQESSWNSTNYGAWASGNFTVDWSLWGTRWTNLVTNLKNWSGKGDYSYTSSSGNFVKISSIAVNSKLADSLFQAS
jgi:hypothetical protein